MSIDLRTEYGGLILSSPMVVGACPLTLHDQDRDKIESAGAAAIVLPSVFEEQVIKWSQTIGRTLSDVEREIAARADRTRHNWACNDAESYLSLVKRASSLQTIPVIASMNGFTAGGWMDFAGELQEAGADAIELNVHHEPACEYQSAAAIESTIVDAVRDINAAITIPLFVKIDQNFTSIPHLARQLMSGAQGLVLYGLAPGVDICLDSLKLKSEWDLARSGCVVDSLEMLMRVHSYCPALSLASSGGIGHADDVIKVLLAGADVAMVASAVYRDGAEVIRSMIDGLKAFMDRHDLSSMADLQMKRPLEFTSDEARLAYTDALAARGTHTYTSNT